MLVATIIFMVLVAAMCIFSVTVIVIDLKRSKKQPQADTETTATEPAAVPSTASAAPQAEPQAAAVVAEDEHSVVFNAQQLTHSEKYAQLEGDNKEWYDRIVTHVCTVKGIKRKLSDRYEEFRLFTKRIVRLTIKKGIVQCEYSLGNDELNRFMSGSRLAVKHSTTVIKLVSEKETVAAENAIDIAVAAVLRERAERHQRDLERRREARRRAASSADN